MPRDYDAEAALVPRSNGEGSIWMRKALGDCQTILQVLSLSHLRFRLEPLLAPQKSMFQLSTPTLSTVQRRTQHLSHQSTFPSLSYRW
jgi:hypothetical protein